MATIILKQKNRLADQFIVYVRNKQGNVTKAIELTEAQYLALAEKGAGAPPGVGKADWESGLAFAAQVRNYGNGQRFLNLGEYEELADRFELGLPAASRSKHLAIWKDKVLSSKVAGLTLKKLSTDAWPEWSKIASIVDGVLTTLEA